MATNWLRITHQSETIQLSWQRGYENRRLAPAVSFQQLFDEENAAELRWYLEDYLSESQNCCCLSPTGQRSR